jgi:hypothetical protein
MTRSSRRLCPTPALRETSGISPRRTTRGRPAMGPRIGRCIRVAACSILPMTVMLLPENAWASDFSPMMVWLMGAAALLFAAGFGVVWFVTRYVRQRWLRVLIRVTGIALFWTPVQQDGAGYWWPMFFSWSNLPALPEKGVAIVSVIVAIGVLWLLGMTGGSESINRSSE